MCIVTFSLNFKGCSLRSKESMVTSDREQLKFHLKNVMTCDHKKTKYRLAVRVRFVRVSGHLA